VRTGTASAACSGAKGGGWPCQKAGPKCSQTSPLGGAQAVVKRHAMERRKAHWPGVLFRPFCALGAREFFHFSRSFGLLILDGLDAAKRRLKMQTWSMTPTPLKKRQAAAPLKVTARIQWPLDATRVACSVHRHPPERSKGRECVPQIGTKAGARPRTAFP
jgi:hypothetical protein